MKQIKRTLALAAFLAIAAQSHALDFDFSGTFTKDNDVLGLSFTVGAPSTITIFSSSWLSGDIQAGFDPILAIWNSAGIRMAQQDDGGVAGTTSSNGTPYNHGVWDSYYSVTLAAGDYLATIAQYNNFSTSNNLADGFAHDGNPNFTFDNTYGGATQPLFNGVWDGNDPRTGNWAFHILNVESAVVIPPPSVPDGGTTLALLGGALAGLGALRRKMIA